MPRLQPILLLILGASLLAQQPGTTSAKSGVTNPRGGTSSYDPTTVAAAIRNSYYHPDKMSGLDCSLSFDWAAFFSALKLNLAGDRLKEIQSLKIRSKAIRGKSPTITFEWNSGALDNREQFEDGLKQVLGGFYQVYWSMVASSPLSTPDEITKIEPLPDGGAKVYSSSQNIKVVITTDKEGTPTHYTLESPAMNGTVDLNYTASPNPIPGDLRRISGMDVSEQIGNSTMSVTLTIDYQDVSGLLIPGHVSYSIGGAYSLVMDFSGCTVSRGAAGH